MEASRMGGASWAAAGDSAMSAEKLAASGRSLGSSDAKMAAEDAHAPTAFGADPASWSPYPASYPGADSSSWSPSSKSAGASWASSAKMKVASRPLDSGRRRQDDAQPAIPILQQEYEMNDPSSYMYSYKTANGIAAQEQASMKSGDAEAVQGVYSWEAPNGEKFSVEYVADETGYHARGAHIPEIPRAIARSLEWNAAHPEEEDSHASAAFGPYPASYPGADSSSWSPSSKSAGASWASSAKMNVASGRSAWQSESSAALPAWKSTSVVKTVSAAQPAWESAAASSGRSSWESHSAGAALPASRSVKITETYHHQGAVSGLGAGHDSASFLPAGRPAWA
ncbi:Endocuticle structural glycoprotein SgAbd-2 [Frankliniella fusca]|uniref:Endocuticle structural glycoprotein SgAbd-2 n=1 Tax=Frankliniella fusca TaxID=407009 RepID=A0AAE1LVD8_9NEOP|nr:Endocuticle structural glycoprotein SgAbd-2 [Frankliniella fusca]